MPREARRAASRPAGSSVPSLSTALPTRISATARGSGAGSGPLASTIAPSRRSSRASTRSPVQRSVERRSIRAGEPALDVLGGQRQRRGDPRRLRLALRIADRQPFGRGERRGRIERIAAPAGREPGFARGIAAAGEVVGQRHRGEEATPGAAGRRAPSGLRRPLALSLSSAARCAQPAASLREASARGERSPFQRASRCARSSPCPPSPRSCSSSASFAASPRRAVLGAVEQHRRLPRLHRQRGELAPALGDPPLRVERVELRQPLARGRQRGGGRRIEPGQRCGIGRRPIAPAPAPAGRGRW